MSTDLEQDFRSLEGRDARLRNAAGDSSGDELLRMQRAADNAEGRAARVHKSKRFQNDGMHRSPGRRRGSLAALAAPNWHSPLPLMLFDSLLLLMTPALKTHPTPAPLTR